MGSWLSTGAAGMTIHLEYTATRNGAQEVRVLQVDPSAVDIEKVGKFLKEAGGRLSVLKVACGAYTPNPAQTKALAGSVATVMKTRETPIAVDKLILDVGFAAPADLTAGAFAANLAVLMRTFKVQYGALLWGEERGDKPAEARAAVTDILGKFSEIHTPAAGAAGGGD